jgi:hypothetical protein
MNHPIEQHPNPRRVAAGKANRKKRGPLTEAGRESLRAAAIRNRPWERSTGPRTTEGKAQAVINGKPRQTEPRSAREVRADLREVRILIRRMREITQQVRGI